mgnify:CR=1 FL=1
MINKLDREQIKNHPGDYAVVICPRRTLENVCHFKLLTYKPLKELKGIYFPNIPISSGTGPNSEDFQELYPASIFITFFRTLPGTCGITLFYDFVRIHTKAENIPLIEKVLDICGVFLNTTTLLASDIVPHRNSSSNSNVGLFPIAEHSSREWEFSSETLNKNSGNFITSFSRKVLDPFYTSCKTRVNKSAYEDYTDFFLPL